MTKKISLKGLSDFMTLPAARQRTLIHQYKYPLEDEAFAKIIYYREARDIIAAYHRSKQSITWLSNQATKLSTSAACSSGRTQIRLDHNARAVQSYSIHFASRKFDVLNDISFRLVYGDVILNIVPDLYVKEKNKQKIVKLEFSIDAPDSNAIKIVSQSMFEAAQVGGLNLTSSGILYLDVERGIEHRGARLGSVMKKNIEAACLNISSIWDGI